MTKPTFVVETNCLFKRFENSVAVDNLSLKVSHGEKLGLLGPNGAGKSTTLKMLLGIVRASSGSVHILGMNVEKEFTAIRRRVGYVPDEIQFYRWMTVEETIRFVKPMYCKTWNDKLVESLLVMFELNPTQRVRHLSSGMLSKLSLLIAIAHEPSVLILDEPLTGLDPIARDEFIDVITHNTDHNNQTIIFSSHQLEEVSSLVDSVAIMFKGKLLVHRSIRGLVDCVRRIQVSCPNEVRICPLPENVIRQQVVGQDWLITVDQYDEKTIAWIQQKCNCKITAVQKMNLKDIFKDFVRGEMERKC